MGMFAEPREKESNSNIGIRRHAVSRLLMLNRWSGRYSSVCARNGMGDVYVSMAGRLEWCKTLNPEPCGAVTFRRKAPNDSGFGRRGL